MSDVTNLTTLRYIRDFEQRRNLKPTVLLKRNEKIAACPGHRWTHVREQDDLYADRPSRRRDEHCVHCPARRDAYGNLY